MFTHDPFQAYQTLAAFAGGATPYGSPYQAIHPSAYAMQPFANPGITGFGPYAQQLQGFPQQGQGYPQPVQAFAQQLGYPQQQLQGGIGQPSPWQQLQGWNPLAAGLQNPIQHHQLGHQPLQNPLLAASLQNPFQNPMINPMLAYQAWQQQQTPFGYPLAPQTLIGGAGIGQPYGQFNPLAQLALRQSGLGLSPFAGY
jgi:hypothetical protein